MNTRSYDNMQFCSVCQHRVHDMEKHAQSEDHKRQVKGRIRTETGYGARTPVGVSRHK